MITYRCAGCGKDVEAEEISVPGDTNIVEISPCEVCVDVAEEAVKEESYDTGYQEGWQAGYDTAVEEEEEEEEEKKEKQEKEVFERGISIEEGCQR